MFKFSIVCTIFLTLFQAKTIHANDEVNKIVTSHSTEYGLHYIHALNPKETIYSLSKFSGASVQEIYDVNRLSSTAILSIGQELIIPLHPESVITDAQIANAHKQSLVKVMYQVKKKDNLFQIAKRRFTTDINTIVVRNGLSGLTISPNQVLHIGWISIDKNFPVAFKQANAVHPQISTTEPSVTTIVTNTTVSSTIPSRPDVTASKTYERENEVITSSTYQTASEVVNDAMESVSVESDGQSESSVEKPKYRVVQHTPLHKKEKTETPVVEVKAEVTENIQQPSVQTTTTEMASASVASVPVNNETTVSTSTVTTTNIASSEATSNPASATTTTTKNETIKNRDYPDLSFLSSPNLLTIKGIAVWDKNDNEPLNMFILHQDAKIGSYIRIENPMLGRIVLAKVVARLPTNVYDQDVKMVVSSAVASSLGVKDSRFLAEMKYIRL